MGTAASGLFEAIPQGYIHQSSHKWQTEPYLVNINEQAQERFERLIGDMKQAHGITEQLKSENQLIWVQKLNNIRDCAREIVEKEMIYK